jgi:hypothetical protein
MKYRVHLCGRKIAVNWDKEPRTKLAGIGVLKYSNVYRQGRSGGGGGCVFYLLDVVGDVHQPFKFDSSTLVVYKAALPR